VLGNVGVGVDVDNDHTREGIFHEDIIRMFIRSI
jgi:hypothetical protein